MPDVPQAFSIDFSDVPEREAAPAGEYLIEVVAAEVRTSGGAKTAGQPMLWLHWKIVGGEYDNTRIFENLQLTGDARWKTRQLFNALGLVGKGQKSFSGDASELVGVQCRGRLTAEVWAIEDGGDGDVQNKVARYLPFSDDAQAASLDDLFKSA